MIGEKMLFTSSANSRFSPMNRQCEGVDRTTRLVVMLSPGPPAAA
jgi:hypothetical protein